jgi:hypothetical protein
MPQLGLLLRGNDLIAENSRSKQQRITARCRWCERRRRCRGRWWPLLAALTAAALAWKIGLLYCYKG